MRAKRRRLNSGTGHANQSWPVLMLLLLLILVPTIFVLWFMNEAVQNEQLAVREKLRDAYRGHLTLSRDQLDVLLARTLQECDRLAREDSSAVVFDLCVRNGLADSVLCFDSDGQLGYPAETSAPARPGANEAAWREANRLEYVENDFVAAARTYESIAKGYLDNEPAANGQAARAWQAVARCYARAGQNAAALEILTDVLEQPQYAHAIDFQGRFIVADVELRALELMSHREDADFHRLAERLEQRLLDYGTPELASAQRRFLMSKLKELHPSAEFPTLEAEKLAAAFLESQLQPTTRPVLVAAGLPDVWQIAAHNGRVLLLLKQATLIENAQKMLATQPLPQEVTINVLPPSAKSSPEPVFMSLAAGTSWPDWRLTLAVKDRDFFDAASRARVTAYFWTGILGVGTIAALALIIGRSIRNQTRVAGLKNDLVATITHELKTPLSSMRLLVDTLVDQEQFDERQVREYLQLIGKENKRLSRLIDSFLAFSRIERNKYRFEFEPIDPEKIIEAAVDSVHERLYSPECQFDLQIEPNLPFVVADADALITVLLNLLDNAYKYTGDEKQICLRVYTADGDVCFEVEDNGIGLARREEQKIFKRFYQANQHLSRSGGGCGLGLSIVQYIVEAHGGTVQVTSHQGRGSKFTVKLSPAPNEVSQVAENLIP